MESLTEGEEEAIQPEGPMDLYAGIGDKVSLHPQFGCWVDITEDFFEASKELALGELLHDEMFGLFEAMSAIEMMDPKMDAGMVCNRGSTVLTFDKAVKNNTLKLNNLSMEELVGVMDCMFGCVVTWLEGHSAAQTVFTCLYLHKPLSIEDRPLRAFCVLLLKLVALVKSIVTIAGVYEEEDFQTSLHGYGVCAEVPEARAAAAVREVEEELQRVVKSCRGKCGEQVEEKAQKQHDDAVALFSRIRFLRLLYAALSAIMRRDQVSMAEADSCLSSCTELASIMKDTVHRGARPKPTRGEPNKGDYGHAMGFEPLVNQRLLPPTFPRCTRLRSRREALLYLEELVTRIRHSGRVTHATTFQQTVDFLERFSEQEPCVMSRSIAQVLYLGAEPDGPRLWGGRTMADTLREAARLFINPPALQHKTTVLANPQAQAYVDAFFQSCVRPFEQLVTMTGHNRARQRDKVTDLLREFVALQAEADALDAFLHTMLLKSEQPRPHLAYFSNWIMHHTLRLMLTYVLTGFSLQLYAAHEYVYVYWYLQESLYPWQGSTLRRANTLLAEGEGGGEPNKGRRRVRKARRARQPYGREITLCDALLQLCGGYYKAMIGLRECGKVVLPAQEFDSEAVRFQHRFAPFSAVQNPPPASYQTFQGFQELSNFPEQPVTAFALYNDARFHFYKAKQMLEGLHNPTSEMQALLKIIKSNIIIMKLLYSGHKKDDPSPPTFDFTYHSYFPIIRIVQ